MDFTSSQDWNYVILGFIGVGVGLLGFLVMKLFKASEYNVINESTHKKGSKGSRSRKGKHKKKKNKKEGKFREDLSDDMQSNESFSDVEEGSLRGALDDSNRRLFDIFLSVLGEGISITKHNDRDSIKIILHMNYEKKSLTYKPFSGWAPRKKGVKLQDLVSVWRGKESNTFQTPRLTFLQSDVCFTLVLSSGVELNLEANSKMERDALCQGFELLIEKREDESKK